jgi:hypothetical protein
MKKYFILIKMLVLFFHCSFAQQNTTIAWQSVNSGGSSLLSSGTINISQTIGQTAANTLASGNLKLTQGFQQGKIEYSLATKDNKPIFAQISVFPNPTSDVLQVKISESEPSNYFLEWRILNLLGQPVAQGTMMDNSQLINVTDLVQGEYVIQLFSKNKQNNIVRFAKFLKIK